MNDRRTERGSALIGAVLISIILSMLATVSLNVAAQEIESGAAAKDEAVARHLAEAGTDLVIRWFHDPSSVPAGPARALLVKRQPGSDGSPSFFDAAGQSRFTGTEGRPDLLYDAARPADDRLLNDPSSGWFRALGAMGRITRLAVYGPSRPGLLCTVQVTAQARRLTRTLAIQFGAAQLPPIRAGVQIGVNRPVQAGAKPLPISVHWGDLVVNGDVRLGAVRDIPAKAGLAAVTGQIYADMEFREDRWFDLFVGGTTFFAPQQADSVAMPANVHIHQEPSPGLQLDRWDYQTLKKAALQDGTYYVRGPDGLLYRGGRIEPGLGVTATDAFRSTVVGDPHGLVFVDTLDQAPPRADNLGTLVLDADYMEGLFVVNANVRFAPGGSGQAMPARSPEATEPVQLGGINLHGSLVTPGSLVLDRNARIYGAVIVGGAIEQASGTDAQLEVWFNDEFQAGLLPGLPLVYPASGSWLEKYGVERT